MFNKEIIALCSILFLLIIGTRCVQHCQAIGNVLQIRQRLNKYCWRHKYTLDQFYVLINRWQFRVYVRLVWVWVFVLTNHFVFVLIVKMSTHCLKRTRFIAIFLLYNTFNECLKLLRLSNLTPKEEKIFPEHSSQFKSRLL